MRIATWNMGCGPKQSQFRKLHAEAWTYLLDTLRPDVALVQEALVSSLEARRSNHEVTLCKLEPGVSAGTSVLARGAVCTPAETLFISAQSYAATTCIATSAGPLVVASVHLFPGKQLHADLARLVELLRDTFGELPVLVGGDFNAARRIDEVYGGKKHATFFEKMESVGLHQVHWRLHGKEVQSFWGRQAKEHYQDDHFFLSSAWASRVRSCEVIDDEVVRRVSDHGPMVLELDV